MPRTKQESPEPLPPELRVIGPRIKQEVKARGLTQEQFAARFGYDQGNFSRFCNGNAGMWTKSFIRMLQELAAIGGDLQLVLTGVTSGVRVAVGEGFGPEELGALKEMAAEHVAAKRGNPPDLAPRPSKKPRKSKP